MRFQFKIVFSSFFSFLVTYFCFNTVHDSYTARDESKRAPGKIQKSEDMERFLIFIGGMPRSGTTLMRTMMDAHPDIRCGQETHVIPDILNARSSWTDTSKKVKLLEDSGVLNVLEDATAKFIFEIISKHGPEAKILCDKDPFNLLYSEYLHTIFPNSKFVLMVRDGRASAHSIVSRKIIIGTWNTSSYREVLVLWNERTSKMYHQCLRLGEAICHIQHYEQLVLQPVKETKTLFEFLDLPWNEAVLHHDKHINDTKLSSFEASTDQVKKSLYLDALSSWFGQIPPDVERDMAKIAPMLSVLGYDPYNPTPTYGEPDEFILSKIYGESMK